LLETDASDYALGAILSQRQLNKKIHPYVFLSRKFSLAEMNYDIHDKEMSVIIQSFKEWEPLLKSCQHQITVWTDHKNLEYFTSTKTPTRRQARWAEFLAEFDFVVKYRPGEKNGKPDAVSRHWDHRPKEGSEDLQPVQLLFKPEQLRLAATRIIQMRDMFREEVLETALRDADWLATRQPVLQRNSKVDKNFTVQNDLLLWKNRWFIPNDKVLQRKILEVNHDSRIAGHFGIHKTLERIKANYHWIKLEEDINDYVRSCDICQRDKPSRHKKYGLLAPLEIPYRSWSSISID